jgi:GntR family transcriptional regulator, trigonelline degradation regulator
MDVVFEKIPSHTLRSQIAERMRCAILAGTLKEGQRLVERQLAAQFATSLTAVREALIELEATGFVIKRPNATTHVTTLSKDADEKIFAFRRILEGFAVEEAARKATSKHLEVLDAIYLRLLDAARTKEATLFIQTDFSLHQQIWRIMNNEYVYDSLHRILLPYFAFTAIRVVSHRPFDLVQDVSSHLPLLESIKAKHPTAARKAFNVALDTWLEQARTLVYGESEG